MKLLNPGVVTLYDVWSGNGTAFILQPTTHTGQYIRRSSTHRILIVFAWSLAQLSNCC